MLRAATDGLALGSGSRVSGVLAITVLTSLGGRGFGANGSHDLAWEAHGQAGAGSPRTPAAKGSSPPSENSE